MIKNIMYKLSEYNFFVPLNKGKKFVIYNTISNALIESDVEQVELLKSLIGSNSLDNLKDLFNDNIDLLIKDGIFISTEVDEKELIKNRTIQLRRDFDSSKFLYITICPTNACNLRCIYCFEKEKGEKVIENNNSSDIINYIESIIKEQSNIQTLDIMWYGGEPLMNFKYIEDISEKLILLANKFEKEYKAGIITNGTLLSQEIIDRFEQLKISDVQISIDGGKSSHNKKRIYKEGKGTYDVILKNASLLPKKLKTTIRIHCDTIVLNSLNELFSDLEKHGIWPQRAGFVTLNLANLKSDGNISEGEFFKAREFFRIMQLRYYNRWARNNNVKQAGLKVKYPSIMTPFCGTASSVNGCVIDDKGYASKCFEDVYCKDKNAFHLKDKNSKNNNYTNYVDYNKFTSDIKCNNCKIMPICETNCIKLHLENKVSCSEWKYLLPYHLKKYYLREFTNK
jgi:uncharacterized protein